MIHSALKRIVPFMLALLVVLSLPMTAYAAETNFDINRTGSIQVRLRDVSLPDQTIGGTLELYKVGDAREVNQNLTFEPTAEFGGVSLADISASGLAEQLASYAADHALSGQSASADETGTVSFTDLSTGLYLVVQTETENGYLAVSPFLVSLPTQNAEGDGWLYTVEAAPKVQRPVGDPVTLTVVKKWLDNDRNRPDSLTVNLLRDGEFFASVELNETNDWKYTWDDLDSNCKWSAEEAKVPAGYTAAYSTYGNTVTITNTADWYEVPKEPDKLIQTGQLNWPVPVLVCGGLSFLLVGTLLLMRKRKQDL